MREKTQREDQYNKHIREKIKNGELKDKETQER